MLKIAMLLTAFGLFITGVMTPSSSSAGVGEYDLNMIILSSVQPESSPAEGAHGKMIIFEPSDEDIFGPNADRNDRGGSSFTVNGLPCAPFDDQSLFGKQFYGLYISTFDAPEPIRLFIFNTICDSGGFSAGVNLSPYVKQTGQTFDAGGFMDPIIIEVYFESDDDGNGTFERRELILMGQTQP